MSEMIAFFRTPRKRVPVPPIDKTKQFNDNITGQHETVGSVDFIFGANRFKCP